MIFQPVVHGSGGVVVENQSGVDMAHDIFLTFVMRDLFRAKAAVLLKNTFRPFRQNVAFHIEIHFYFTLRVYAAPHAVRVFKLHRRFLFVFITYPDRA